MLSKRSDPFRACWESPLITSRACVPSSRRGPPNSALARSRRRTSPPGSYPFDRSEELHHQPDSENREDDDNNQCDDRICYSQGEKRRHKTVLEEREGDVREWLR